MKLEDECRHRGSPELGADPGQHLGYRLATDLTAPHFLGASFGFADPAFLDLSVRRFQTVEKCCRELASGLNWELESFGFQLS